MDCCDNAGGRVILTIGPNNPFSSTPVQRFATRGGVTIRPTNFERTAEANDDGSLYVKTKAVPAEAEFTLSDRCGLTLDMLEDCWVDATFDLIDMRKRFLFTKATIVGRPEYKTESGEITGLKIASSRATQLPY